MNEERPSWWSRVKRWWRGSGPAPVAATREVSVQSFPTQPLVVPARGGSFAFTVHHELLFTASGSVRWLEERARELESSAVSDVLNRVWPVGAHHLPHDAPGVEAAMNQELRRRSLCYDDGTVRCSPTVRVVADERVLAARLPQWERLVVADAELQTQLHRIDLVVTLMERWAAVLERFGDNPPLAVQSALLVDKEVRAAFHGLATTRRENTRELRDLLQSARDAHEFGGLFEFAQSFDVALRSFELQAGLRGEVLRDRETGPDAERTSA